MGCMSLNRPRLENLPRYSLHSQQGRWRRRSRDRIGMPRFAIIANRNNIIIERMTWHMTWHMTWPKPHLGTGAVERRRAGETSSRKRTNTSGPSLHFHFSHRSNFLCIRSSHPHSTITFFSNAQAKLGRCSVPTKYWNLSHLLSVRDESA